jgi:hypothetical protein
LLVLERQLSPELEWDVQVEVWWAEGAAHGVETASFRLSI